MNGVASLGIGYNGKEISLSGYKRFNFDAKQIHFSNNKYKVCFGFKPDIYTDEIDKSYYVNELYLFANGKKVGVEKITRNTLHASSGVVHLPGTCFFDIYRRKDK